ncbi:Ig domain-containing protein [Anaerobium acetethylicum]|uniref:Ig-like domain (Group 3) n=1 Tax=Anaerobium acetethylicum TaxID=1619234 RepID=A0A1D3TY11_9FIRM|nr:Ig domain-containing protein [Anaerobium acetethylicum]SCP99275.1 Ig-like domain (group 3) [Anaerobium acetethylicum]
MRKHFRILVSVFTALILTLNFVPGAVGIAADYTDKSAMGGDSTIAGDPVSEYLSIQVGPDGRFNSGGTPAPGTTPWYNISYAYPGAPWTSFSTIKVDGSNFIYGSSGLRIQAPTEDALSMANTSIWKYGDVEVKQTLQIVNGTSGNLDTGMYKYTVTNAGTVSHNVGVRIMIDTMLNNNDAAPFRVPGVGAVTTEMEFTGTNIPQYWQAFYSLSNPDIMAQGTLVRSGDTPPDRFVLSNWENIYYADSVWDYTIHAGVSNGDSAATCWWNPVSIAAGESREFVTYYGLGSISGTLDLAITGATSLDIVGGQWSPNPFTVTAYVSNNTGAVMNNVPVTIGVPAGLGLQLDDTAIHTIPSIAIGATEQTSWNVVAMDAGEYTYSVTGIGQTASRQISVPQLPPADLISPQTTCSTTPTANSNGWCNSDVSVSLAATDNDGGSGVKEIHYVINSGSEQVVAGGSVAFSLTGTETFTFWAVDNAGNIESTQSQTINIDKIAPSITTSPQDLQIVPLTSGMTFTYTTTDDSSGIDTATGTINGTPITGGSYPISAAGVYNFSITATDKAGNSATSSGIFVVYDPSAGFVTGGGWFDSPTGAYPADSTLTGKAIFGFVSKYQKGAFVTTGNTEFQFQVADLNFHSTSYEWLVIAGSRAQYKGTGTINGFGDYGFILTAIDGGSKCLDQFRIKIWDKSNDTVIYDNKIDASDDSSSLTTLGGGNIVIHK